MATYTSGETRQPVDLSSYLSNGSALLDSRRTRPLWFDGRFLAARDLEREQNYFLQRQADLGRASGFGVIQGLTVDTVSSNRKSVNAETIILRSGQGVTPAGEMVQIPSDLELRVSDLIEQQSLDVEFGIAAVPPAAAKTRSGLFVIALQPVQFTANPITAYPTTRNGVRSKVDGDIVEATAIVLIPYPGPPNTNDATTLHAALARQIFVTGNPGTLSESLLPLTMISMQGGVIEWIDPWLVRREAGVAYTGLHFGLTDPAVQQSFLLQYDSQLQQAVNVFVRQKLPARFAATSYFQAIPPAGRFPIASISTDGFTHIFFPPQIDVRLSILPEDELPALMADSLALPPIDLTLDPSAYADLAVFAFIPVPRQGFADLAAKLPAVGLNNIIPQVLSARRPLDLLRFYQGDAGINQPSGADNNSWQTAVGSQTYGYYIRRRSDPPLVILKTPPPPPTTTAAPTTTPEPTTTTTTTTTTPEPTTTATTTTTAKPTTTAAPTTTTTTTTTTTPTPTTTAEPTTTTTTPEPTTTTTTTTTARPTTTAAPTTTTTTTTTPKPTTTTTTTTTAKPTTTAAPTTTTTTTTTPKPTTTTTTTTTAKPTTTAAPTTTTTTTSTPKPTTTTTTTTTAKPTTTAAPTTTTTTTSTPKPTTTTTTTTTAKPTTTAAPTTTTTTPRPTTTTPKPTTTTPKPTTTTPRPTTTTPKPTTTTPKPTTTTPRPTTTTPRPTTTTPRPTTTSFPIIE